MDSIEIMDKVENNMIQVPVEDGDDIEDDYNFEEEETANMWYLAISDYTARDSNNRDMSLVKDEVSFQMSMNHLSYENCFIGL